MLNAVTYALQQVQFEIPRDILNKMFVGYSQIPARVPVSLDARVREVILEGRVLQDLNLFGGKELVIPLLGLPAEYIDQYNTVYRIPKSLTGGGTITRAISMGFGEGVVYANAAPAGTTMASNQVMDAAAGVMQSQASIPMVSTTYCHVVGENVVHIMDNSMRPENMNLRCWISHDNQLTHLMPSTYPHFARLVIFAVKAWIYVNAQTVMDKAFIVSGAELGRFRDTVESYSDANENYQDFLINKWRKISILNDQVASARVVKLASGGLW